MKSYKRLPTVRERAIAALALRQRNNSEFWYARLEELKQGLAPWAQPLFSPCRYKIRYGGRGSGKSTAFADALLIIGASTRCKILCVREFQVSIRDSVHSLLKQRVQDLGLEDLWTIGRDRIVGKNGTEFLFKGIRHNTDNIKSIPGITHCWVEEGQSISKESWDVLVPTIREDGSEIWVSFNPTDLDDIVYHEFVENRDSYPNADIVQVNWRDNPWFPEVLHEERLRKQAIDPDAYQHIWEGKIWERSSAQVFAGKWSVDEFSPTNHWDGPYLGADFGFSQDPTALVMSWVWNDTLYIEHESYHLGLELDKIVEQWYKDVPGCDRHPVYADSARPDTINYLQRHGLPRIVGAPKGKGSIQDGIERIRGFSEVVIHPRCRATVEEFRTYRYKVDGLGNVTSRIIDANNHIIDALRYSTCGMGRTNYRPPTAHYPKTAATVKAIFGR